MKKINKQNNIIFSKKSNEIKAEYENEGYVTITYSSNANEQITLRDALGNESSVEFIINIPAGVKILSNIEITTAPTKTRYIAGENFDKAGMKVTAQYNDGSREEVTNYIVTDGENLPEGKTSVTISYTKNGVTKTATQSITVTVREEENLEVEIETYKKEIEGDIQYIKNIAPKTTIEELKNNIRTNGAIKIKKGTEEIREEGAKIGTGMTIEITLNSKTEKYTVVVTGDVNGDGQANFNDILRINKYRLGKTESL